MTRSLLTYTWQFSLNVFTEFAESFSLSLVSIFSEVRRNLYKSVCKNGRTLEFFTNFPEYKNINIANFVLSVPVEINQTLKYTPLVSTGI